MLLDVLRQVFHFAALQMNEFPAFFAFTMIRLLFTFMSAITNIFKTRTAASVNHIFSNQSFTDHFFLK